MRAQPGDGGRREGLLRQDAAEARGAAHPHAGGSGQEELQPEGGPLPEADPVLSHLDTREERRLSIDDQLLVIAKIH